ALGHGDAHGQHTHQEIWDGIREAHESLPEGPGSAAHSKERDAEQRGHSGIEPARGPEDDGDQCDDERPLAAEWKAVEQRREQEARGADQNDQSLTPHGRESSGPGPTGGFGARDEARRWTMLLR